MAYNIDTLVVNNEEARCRFTHDGLKLSFEEVLNLWQSSERALESYLKGIKELGFDQFYWEHPALNAQNMHLPYECMMLRTNHFDNRKIDPIPFAKHLKKSEPVAVFENLGRNALLVVPTLKSDQPHYKHFGAFLNYAPTDQIKEVFKAVGKSVLKQMNNGKRIW